MCVCAYGILKLCILPRVVTKYHDIRDDIFLERKLGCKKAQPDPSSLKTLRTRKREVAKASFIDKRKKMSDKRNLIAVIGDEDTTTGLLLAGVGQVTQSTQEKNFFVYQESKTSREEISDAFENFTRERSDIAILLINQHVAEKIRSQVDGFTDAFPAILEIPSKEHPYNPEKDSVLRRVRRLFGE